MRMRKRTVQMIAAGSCVLTLVGCDNTPPVASETGALQSAATTEDARRDRETRTPIKHVVVIVGENRTFDHVFATYKARHGQYVDNLLSKHIIREDGSPGENYAFAHQDRAIDKDHFDLSPGGKSPYTVLPPALAGGPKTPYITNLADAKAAEPAIADDYYQYLLTGGTGLASGAIDTRLPNPTTLPPGPFQLTPGIAYDDYAASPVHRFYQMWQQLDCAVATVTRWNPSGCKSDLFPWVEVSVGAGANGKPQPPNFDDTTTREGSTAMGFYNVLQGDAPYFKHLADHYAMSRQLPPGGPGWHRRQPRRARQRRRHLVLRRQGPRGDAAGQRDREPRAGRRHQQLVHAGRLLGRHLQRVRRSSARRASARSSTTCTPCTCAPTASAATITCSTTTRPATSATAASTATQFAIPPSTLRTIGDELGEHAVSWRYYGDHWNRYLKDPDYSTPDNDYCDICNPFQYVDVDHDRRRRAHAPHQGHGRPLRGHRQRLLPAVSFVKPSGIVDGHPASSKLNLFEGFTKKLVDAIQKQSAAVEGHGHLRDLRRGRRLLRLGLRAADRLLRRRHAHPDDRRVTVRHRRAHLARVRRPRVDPEVHRAQLVPAGRSRAAAATTCRTRSRARAIPTCR